MRWYIIICLLLVLPIVHSDTDPIIVDCTSSDQSCQLDLYEYVKEYELLLVVDEIILNLNPYNQVINLVEDKSGFCVIEKEGILVCKGKGTGEDHGKGMVQLFEDYGAPTFDIIYYGEKDIKFNDLRDFPTIQMYSSSQGRSLDGILQNMVIGKSYSPTYATLELAMESFSSELKSFESIDIDYASSASVEDEDGSFCSEFSSIEECFLRSEFSDLCDDSNPIDLTEFKSVLFETDEDGGSMIFNFLDGGSEFVNGETHSVFFDAFPEIFLPFQSYMAALKVEEDGSITSVCGYLSDLEGEHQDADLYVLLFDYSSDIYDCSGEFLIYGGDGGSNAYSLPGTKSCITDFKVGSYDVDEDGEYTLTDALKYVFWVIKHRVLGYDDPVYPLDAVEIEVESSVWG